MIKSFILTFIFWTLFIIIDSIMDAIKVYTKFIWYKNSKLWHRLKYFRIGFCVATGWCAYGLYLSISGYEHGLFSFLLLWFLFLRWILFEGLMKIIDKKKFVIALQNGIGSGKGFGFGLVTLARYY
ncbi:hypothetical protein LCGC14_2355200 [marine sediment metagenome]|uniref:Uncharacterized protein n=1 Tax=marine sediment metagenome TaxID=412755 RepID=A0A0F9C8J6_9ZZZZ